MNSPYPGVRIKQSGGVALVQPLEDGMEIVPTMRIDLVKGDVEMVQERGLKKDCLVAPGLLGLYKLKGMSALVVAMATKEVAHINGHPVFQVVETDILLPSTKSSHPADADYLALVRSGTDPKDFGRGLYFSYTKHLTLTLQKDSDLDADPATKDKQWWELEDPRFFWNKYLSGPLAAGGGHAFVLPMIQGFIGELEGLVFSKGSQWTMGSLTLISRRSIQRIGTRHWRRGADKEGSTANFVETEQIVNVENGKTSASFVTIRGSIPIFWTQIPCMKLKPPTKMATKEVFGPAFDRHITSLISEYQEVVGVSLVNSHGSEGMLSSAFIAESNKFRDRGYKLIPFDFHKECGNKNYHRLSVLWKKIETDFKGFGYFRLENGKVTKRQSGVFRTNCIDCLDRTNVVQSILGRKFLDAFLQTLGLLSTGASIESSCPAVEQQFKILWADHGDECALQYGGSGAMKSGFTRTGKRTIGGMVDDGLKFVMRYYLNNFQDGRKQDALDLITGGHKLGDEAAPFEQQLSPNLPFAIVLMLLVFGTCQGLQAFQGSSGALKMSAAAFALTGAIIFWMSRIGSKLVDRPRLRPEQTKQW